MLRAALPCFALLLSGCLSDQPGTTNPKEPGDLLGTYQVDGSLATSTCGAGALGSSSSWDFEVKLTRFEHDIYWLNGQEALVGDIASDGRTFSITTDVDVKVSDPMGAKRGCTVVRHDDAEGKLSAAGTDVKSFDGTLSFSYDALAGSDCTEWVGTEGAVELLPCSMSYDIAGERSAEK